MAYCPHCKYVRHHDDAHRKCVRPGVHWVGPDGSRHGSAYPMDDNKDGKCKFFQPKWWVKLFRLSNPSHMEVRS